MTRAETFMVGAWCGAAAAITALRYAIELRRNHLNRKARKETP